MDRIENNTVYIGKKPMMNYVLAVVSQFNVGSENVVIKARGKSISRAVDVAEIVRSRYVTDLKVREVRIAREHLPDEDGKTTNVSSIEIFLEKPRKLFARLPFLAAGWSSGSSSSSCSSSAPLSSPASRAPSSESAEGSSWSRTSR